jgi:hypothetical protein
VRNFLQKIYLSFASLKTAPVYIIATIAALAAQYYTFTNNLQFAYGDSFRRLDISRKIYDSIYPGILMQIGTVWLPIPTLINIPFVYIDWLWYTGAGAAILNFFVFILNAVIIFYMLKAVVRNPAVVWFGTLLFIFNPNILYFQTTGMSENLFILFLTMSVYFLIQWHKTSDDEYLIFSGIIATFAAGTRYEGWFFVFLGTLAIIAHCFVFRKKYIFNVSSFSLFAIVFVLSWFLFNYAYFGDPLSFQRGQFSSELIAKDIEKTGGLFAKGDINKSITTTLDDISLNVTPFIALFSLLGAILFLNFRNLRSNSIFAYLLLATIPLTIFSLYTGQIFIILPDSNPSGYLNTRYGLYLLPAVCLFVSYFFYWILNKFKVNRPLSLALIIILLSFYLYDNYKGFPQNSPAYYEASILKFSGQRYYRLSEFLDDNYKGGKVMVANNEINIWPNSKIDMENRIYAYNKSEFVDSLKANINNVNWILFMDESTIKYTEGGTIADMTNDIKKRFEFVYYDQGVIVYKRKNETLF